MKKLNTIALALGLVLLPLAVDAMIIGPASIHTSTGYVKEADLNAIVGTVAGTSKASAFLRLDANKHTDVLGLPVSGLKIGPTGSETVVSATGSELNANTDAIASMATSATPASGSNAVQLTFKNAAGVAVGSVRRVEMYMSNSSGVPDIAASSVAVLTNGTLDPIVTAKVWKANTTAAGLFGVTVTRNAGSVYVSAVLPNGQIVTSSVLTVN